MSIRWGRVAGSRRNGYTEWRRFRPLEVPIGQDLLIPPGSRVRLTDHDPSFTGKLANEAESLGELNRLKAKLYDLHSKLYADDRFAVLLIIQAMDTGGKDGVIRSVMTGVDPTGCSVTSFKVPSSLELDHEYLWRIHQAVPPRGNIGIFNRSHYEDVLAVRVHDLVPKTVWKQRYDQINQFEGILAANGVVIRKFFLNISKDEQERRLLARLVNPKKNWKFSVGDLREREHWDAYMEAYEDILSRCSTSVAPWYVIPSNNKWYRNLAVARVLVETLEGLDMDWPAPSSDVKELAREARATGRLPSIKGSG